MDKAVWVKGTNDKLVNIAKADQIRIFAVEVKGHSDPTALPGSVPNTSNVIHKLVCITGGGPLQITATLAKGSELDMKKLLVEVQLLLDVTDLQTPAQKQVAGN